MTFVVSVVLCSKQQQQQQGAKALPNVSPGRAAASPQAGNSMVLLRLRLNVHVDTY
jgi:hypothetical protein